MKFVTKLAIVCLFATAAATACSSTPTKKDGGDVGAHDTEESKLSAQELFIQGNKALDTKDFAKAISLYDQALEQDDKRWDIYMNKAIALSADRQFDEAVAAIDRALANGGDKEPQVYFNLGNIYQNRGLYAQSVKAYKSSLAVDDEPNVDTLVNLGAALALMREYDQAIATYEHIKTIAPDDPRIYVGLGVVEHARGARKVALQYYEQANRIDPDFQQAWFNKGALLMDMKRHAEAADSFQRYLELAPNGPYAERARGLMQNLNAKK